MTPRISHIVLGSTAGSSSFNPKNHRKTTLTHFNKLFERHLLTQLLIQIGRHNDIIHVQTYSIGLVSGHDIFDLGAVTIVDD